MLLIFFKTYKNIILLCIYLKNNTVDFNSMMIELYVNIAQYKFYYARSYVIKFI